MAGKWSPNKEYKRQQHLVPEYLKNVLNGNKHIDGPRGVISNRGKGSEDGSAFPAPNKSTGRAPWRKK